MLALVVLAQLADLHTTGINLYVGDASAEYGYVPAHATEDQRIRGHLMFAHDVLAAADTTNLTPDLRAARARNLDRLERYARAGQFPRNDDHPDALRPTFVDAHGAICAVGALYASDRGYPAAVHVAEQYKYAFIVQIRDPDLLAWQQTSGLSLAELALIQPSYNSAPTASDRMWLPWGLTDRMQFGAPRISLESAVSSTDDYGTVVSTLHAQSAIPFVTDTTSFYLTLPAGIAYSDRALAARGTLDRDPERFLGNTDVGVYFGHEHWSGPASLFRIGAVLPTASENVIRPPSVRAGDLVLELPRSYGGRISASRLSGWTSIPDSWWFGHDLELAYRIDAGVDYTRSLEGDNKTIVPRAAIGLLFSSGRATMSLDTSVAHAYDRATGDGGLRWTSGWTIRLARRDGEGSIFQPGITLATIRTPESWSGALLLDLSFAAVHTHHHGDYD